MYQKLSEWLNTVLIKDIPDDVIAFGFNLYEDSDYYWSVELVGTSRFDMKDEDWRCDEITDFGTREEPFRWKEETGWENILEDVKTILNKYLADGSHADILKSRQGVGLGFVDGDVEILYVNS